MLSETNNQPADAKHWIRKWAPLVILACLGLITYVMGWHEQVTLSNLIINRAAMHEYVANNFWFSASAYLGLYALATALFFPAASLFTIAGGLVFGAALATILTDIGATLGATVLFLTVRSSFGSFLSERAGPFLAKLSDGFKNNAFSYLLFLRLVPAFPFWLVNLAPALLGVRLSTYVTGTFLGIIPGTFVFASLGSGLDRIVEDQQKEYQTCLADKAAGQADLDCVFSINPGKLLNVEIIAAFVGLGVVALIPIAIKWFRARQAGGEA